MDRVMGRFISLLIISFVFSQFVLAKKISHYVFFNLDRERISEKSFLENPGIAGAQLKYRWFELEKNRNEYDFSEIEKDLKFLTKNNKRLFIQIQDVSFGKYCSNVPNYLTTDPVYSGGVDQQYLLTNKDKIIEKDGCVARRWDSRVAERFSRLLLELGKKFDGRIEGINLPETAVGFGETGKHYPKGFNPMIYRQAILKQMKTLKTAFPKSTALQYANFMPGEWLPWDDKGHLKSLFEYAVKEGIAMGGPDIKIYKRAQMNHSYKFLKKHSKELKTGMAVQWGNLEEVNPKTGKRVTVRELIDFAKKETEVDYVFWGTQEPHYSRDVLTFINQTARKTID